MADASIPDLAARLAEWGPDVVCLQEVRSQAQIDALAARLGPGWHGRLTHQPEIDREVALLTRFAEDACGFEEIPTRAGRHALRLAVTLEDGQRRHIVGCHASPFSARLRRAYFGDVLDRLDLLPERDLVLLAGDFNIDPWLAWLTVDWATLHRLRQGWQRLLGRFTTYRGFLQLDHAWLREQGAVPALARVIKGTRAHGRDHDPLVIDLAAAPPSAR